MSAEKVEDTRALGQSAAPPYEANPEVPSPTPIQPDYAQPQYMEPLAPPQPQQQQYPTATPLYALQRASAPVDCPSCHYREMTRVEFEAGNTTHGWAAVLCCCLCIGCLPYMISSLKDAKHHCAHCGVWLATFHNSGRVEVPGAQPPRK